MRLLNRELYGSDLQPVATKCRNEYQSARPFPNIWFPNFFDEKCLSEILDEFPDLSEGTHIEFQTPNEIKLASKGEYRFPERTKRFMHLLNSQPFLEFLQELTGIKEVLLPDPCFEGGDFTRSDPGAC